MDTLALAAVLCVAGAFVLAFVSFFQSAASPRSTIERRLGAMMTVSGAVQEAPLPAFMTRQERKLGQVPFISTFLQGQTWTFDLTEELHSADIKLNASEFVAIRVLMGLVGVTFALLLVGPGLLGFLAAGVLGFIGFKLPMMYVNFAKGKRVKALDHQLLELLSMVSNSLKSGFGLVQSLELSSRQLEHPMSTELSHLLYDINVGNTTESAFLALARRGGSKDLDIVITAILIQQTTGGNLAEILDNVAHTMRERLRIRGEIKTLTTQQMLTGFIIGGLPFAMAGIFTIISPSYMVPLFTTTIGIVLLAAAALLETFGVLAIKKIMSIEV
jgi:tight adherence protein B